MTKILVSVSEEILKAVDRAAHHAHRSRSAWIRDLVRQYLDRAAGQVLPRQVDPLVRQAVAMQEAIGRRLSGRWESAVEIRRWRASRRQS